MLYDYNIEIYGYLKCFSGYTCIELTFEFVRDMFLFLLEQDLHVNMTPMFL